MELDHLSFIMLQSTVLNSPVSYAPLRCVQRLSPAPPPVYPKDLPYSRLFHDSPVIFLKRLCFLMF